MNFVIAGNKAMRMTGMWNRGVSHHGDKKRPS